MPSNFSFTRAALAASLEQTAVSYDELARIERAFAETEIKILRYKVALTQPLFARRSSIISNIPNFWPLVFEQAPPEIDQYIQPSDFVLFSSSLYDLDVSYFETSQPSTADTPDITHPEPTLQENNPPLLELEREEGDPKSFQITFSFIDNSYFGAAQLTKKFWYMQSKHGGGGFISEPVRIDWKQGKDLTEGLLDLICDAWEASHLNSRTQHIAKIAANGSENSDLTPQEQLLQRKIENMHMGELSFFAWFGYVGRHIDSHSSSNDLASPMSRYLNGALLSDSLDGTERVDYEFRKRLEGFPHGDDLATAIADDLWPGAIKYYTQAQEQDALTIESSTSNDERDLEDNAEEIDAGRDFSSETSAQGPPSKKIRSG